MCAFIHTTITESFINTQDLQELIEYTLEKGGDELSIVILANKLSSRFTFDLLDTSSDHTLSDFILEVTDGMRMFPASVKKELCVFSRQIPEMEESKSIINQPYLPDNNRVVMVHGTIANIEKIENDYNIKLAVDTDIFYIFPFEKACEIVQTYGGQISAIEVTSKSKDYFNTGLGLYKYKLSKSCNFDICTNVTLLDKSVDIALVNNILPNETRVLFYNSIYLRRAVVLMSGGLDITCSIQSYLKNNSSDLTDIEFIYYDYGTSAAASEIKASQEFLKELKSTYSKVGELIVIDIKTLFKEYLDMINPNEVNRLIDDNIIGNKNETRDAISYVPLRNTFLVNLTVANCENKYKDSLYETDIIIGANLSEGMIYLDNSETWLDAMNQSIKVSGQHTKYFNLVAPYINRTKTNMVIDALDNEFNLDHVMSCYYPVNGKPCGKCGSCILKETAISRAVNLNK